ncbi:galactose-3-O-sulfotransferase 2-like isoform X1 [Branchiostoma floridae]|uniref:Galactose-3-O-sulfotransferase 2-like isoform X1 n=1 Tax=Branchiostoma floridae TaxID=7739 RepID=A0A9J7HF41_BRAFL|nr:galactose-3-O-sulfotransferase 2-like isoform X1 [Branchiostoma floridae]XP_035658497.1 galactose-3-O-sulfotransferase 2-like isoform X1 [Branchiostoma floridae]
MVMAREFMFLALFLTCVTTYMSISFPRGWKDTEISVKPAFANLHSAKRSKFKSLMQTGYLPSTQRNVITSVPTSLPTCGRPVTNFVFIKVHKTASGSTFRVLARFGRNHGMTICYPALRRKAIHIQLSYPSGKLTKDDCRPSPGRKYNLIIHHSVMNKPAMDRVMEPGTKYIGIFREPLNHFRSIFFWKRRVARRNENPLGAFLNTTHDRKKTYSKHKNFQAYTMGFPKRLMTSKNETQIYEEIRTVAGWYSVVLITEYWEESLVLLRRKFCWRLYDILHTTQKLHALHTKKEHVSLTTEQEETHRKMSNVDYMMYDYLNKTFWQRVTNEGPEFWEEVTYYKTLNSEVNKHCNSVGGKRVFPAGKWSQEFVIDSPFCKELKWKEDRWADACWDVVERQNEETKQILKKFSGVK